METNARWTTRWGLLSFVVVLLAAACGTDGGPSNAGTNNVVADPNDRDGDGIPNDEEEALGTDPDVADTDGDGRLDGTEVELGTNPTAADSVCVEDRYSADFRFKPVDVIITIDNSGSMREEIEAVEANINENLATILGDAGIDYRVILIGKHGEGGPFDSDICVAAPLSSTTCEPVPEAPANSATFYHYDTEVSSDDAFATMLETFSRADPHGYAPMGWSQWLRNDAFKSMVVVTDDESAASINGEEPTADNFDRQLLELPGQHFGTAGSRNYEFHTIAGLGAKEDPRVAWKADEGLVQTQCPTAESKGLAYQQLSIVTGGVRYPVCAFESYDAVFQEVAEGIIEEAQIDCSLRLPPVGAQQVLATERMALEFKAEEGQPVRVVTRVSGPGECGGDNFYLTETSVELCPELCDVARSSETGTLIVYSECDARLCDTPVTEICDDGVDNDCDGFTDRQDVQCIL